MSIVLREAVLADAEPCGRICYDAFRAINTAHNFPPDFPNPETAIGVLGMMIAHPRIHVLVAEVDGAVAGSNAVDERGPIAGIGPITVAPGAQNAGVGRALMQAVLDREHERGAPGVRLVQAAFHNRSLALYTKLGFVPREPLSCVQGPPVARVPAGWSVRPAAAADVSACVALQTHVHGHERRRELEDAIATGSAAVAERSGRIVAYTTAVAFFGHSVGETDEDVLALVASAPGFGGPGFLVPTRNATLLRWCLDQGLRIVMPMTLMSIGLYGEPRGAWLPSIIF
jgi:GNAT superfamily N-acetyltransferase